MAVDKTNIDWYKKSKKVFDKVENKEDFEKIIYELQTIQDSLIDKKTNIDKVRKELQYTQEQIRKFNLDKKDKDNIDKNFEKLYNNNEEIEINNLNIIFGNIINLLRKHVSDELITLKWSIDPLEGRPSDVKEWIRRTDMGFRKFFANAAKNESSTIGRRAAERINDILNDDLA